MMQSTVICYYYHKTDSRDWATGQRNQVVNRGLRLEGKLQEGGDWWDPVCAAQLCSPALLAAGLDSSERLSKDGHCVLTCALLIPAHTGNLSV